MPAPSGGRCTGESHCHGGKLDLGSEEDRGTDVDKLVAIFSPSLSSTCITLTRKEGV